jgi:hypothetical protein
MLETSLGVADITGTTQGRHAHALGDRAFNTGPVLVSILERLGLLVLACDL